MYTYLLFLTILFFIQDVCTYPVSYRRLIHPRTHQCVDIVGDWHIKMQSISDSEKVLVHSIKDKRYKVKSVLIEDSGIPDYSYFMMLQRLDELLDKEHEKGKFKVEKFDSRDYCIKRAALAWASRETIDMNECSLFTYEQIYNSACKWDNFFLYYSQLLDDPETEIKISHLWNRWKQKFTYIFIRALECFNLHKEDYLIYRQSQEESGHKLDQFWEMENGSLHKLIISELADLGFVLMILASKENCFLYVGDAHAEGVEKLLIDHFGFITCFTCERDRHFELSAGTWEYLKEDPAISYKRVMDYLKEKHLRARRR